MNEYNNNKINFSVISNNKMISDKTVNNGNSMT